MKKSERVKLWPQPDPSKDKTLVRIGSELRKFAADRSVTHEQLGRIVRCIVLGTDVFLDETIAPMVSALAKDADKRERCRLHMIEFRIRKGKKSGISYPSRNAGPGPCMRRRKNEKLLPDVRNEKSRKMLIDLINTGVMGAKRGNRSVFRYEGNEDDDKHRKPAASLPWIPPYFERFWRAYPRKDRPGNALNTFEELIRSYPDPDKFMDALMDSVRTMSTENVPSACSFLCKWRDERAENPRGKR